MTTKTDPATIETAPRRAYVVEHTMIGIPQPVRDDVSLSQNIDSPFALRGDILAEEMLGGGHERLLRIGAIRNATTDEANSPDVLHGVRLASREHDADAASALNLAPDPHEVKGK